MDEFERLFRDYTPVVYRFLLSLCGDAALAEELTDERETGFWQNMKSVLSELCG
ncbi:MAG: hypothetical protein LUE97_04300 [Oscillospiraceae bacterium]|nr:hypothetical protein [Oscillospiraceae bacterium]